MTRKEEAKAIRALKGDTYFCLYFGENDIEQMAQNIENDFCIEIGCNFNRKVEVLNKEIDKLKTKHKQEIIDICHKLIGNIDNGNDEDVVYQIAEEHIGIDAIIKYKHKNGIGFTNRELEYLVSKI